MAISYRDRSDYLSGAEHEAGTGMRWSAVFAGLFAALGTDVLLYTLGAAIGLSVVFGGVDLGGLGIGALIWLIGTSIVSAFVGGFVASYIGRPLHRSVAMMYGGVVWAFALVVGIFLMGSFATGTLQTAMRTAGAASGAIQQQIGGAGQQGQVQEQQGQFQTQAGQEAPAAGGAQAQPDVVGPQGEQAGPIESLPPAAQQAVQASTWFAWTAFISMLLSLGAAIGGAIAAHGALPRTAEAIRPTPPQREAAVPPVRERPLDEQRPGDLH